ncbi:MAG TPA: stage V sporulation protein AD [Clostridiales bacterium]|nr:stage V sporulation protein AD [Clostridiales bacterium]
MVKGSQSFVFESQPVIISSATVGGPLEAEGPLSGDIDILHEDPYIGQDSFEKAEKLMLEEAAMKALEKAGVNRDEVGVFISGDLINQIISSSFAARTIGIPYLGIYGACSSSMEGLIIAASLVDGQKVRYVLTGASSHNNSAERQYRYPNEYGAQKPPTSQWTVTGAGVCLLASEGQGPKVTAATIGRIVDMGITDPFNMGAAMAPAAVDTIETHFKDLGRGPDYYDLIVTGDLGAVGHKIALDKFKEKGININENIFKDCGMMIYDREKQPQVFAGASGCASSAVTIYGHLLNEMRKGNIKRLLAVATGALHSPLSYQQKESIPGIAHAVAIEM